MMSPTSASSTSRPVGLVTGASRGLGAVVSTFLAGEGFDLVLTARGSETLLATALKLEALGSRVTAIPGDVRDPTHRRLLRQAVERLGGLNLLVNNASELGPSPLPPLSRLPLFDLQNILSANLIAPLALVQELLPLLERRAGLVVNISSDAAIGGYAGWGGYGASKAALDLASLTLAHELKGSGVGVVSVDPGDMRTQMHQDAFPGEDITDRPLPEVTLPFWAWLLGQEPNLVTGGRYRAQAERWEVPA